MKATIKKGTIYAGNPMGLLKFKELSNSNFRMRGMDSNKRNTASSMLKENAKDNFPVIIKIWKLLKDLGHTEIMENCERK